MLSRDCKESTMRVMPVTNSLVRRCASLLLALGLATTVAGCGGKHTAATVGVGIGVTLTSPSGVTLLYQGQTIEIDAVVSGDTSGAGVTWSLAGIGTLTTNTKTKIVYQAPAAVTGALTITVTATSITDTTKSAAVTILVNGTPTIAQPVLFPANQSLAYAAYVAVAGGTAPYVWTVATGTLPAGLALDGSTSQTEGVVGTPSALGTSSFTLKVTDAKGLTATVALSVTVIPQGACLLVGRYAYLFTGFYGGLPVARAGSVNVAGDGTVSGVHDYKDFAQSRIDATVTGGRCLTTTGNRGTLQLISATTAETFDYATISSLHSGQMQQNDGTGIVGSATVLRQDATAFTAAAVAGEYALFLVGDDGSRHREAVVGRLTLGADGTVSAGEADSSGSAPAVAATLTGSFVAPDGNGRGTASLTLNGKTLPLAYYVVDANLLYVVSADQGVSTPRLAGRLTRQVGAGSYGASSLASPAIMSVWGSSMVANVPLATMSAGRLSNAVAATGTVDISLDVADRGAALAIQAFTGASFAVNTNGRGRLSFGNGAAARNLVLYLDGASSGYLLEPASVVGNVGIVEPQVGLPFSDFAAAYYMGGTVFAGSTSPITLAPQLLLQAGAISGNLTGSYAIDPTTGRAIASVTRNILGGSGLVIYIVSTGKLVVVGDGVNSVNSSLAWLQKY
jgi:putative Ig domain-containing protein